MSRSHGPASCPARRLANSIPTQSIGSLYSWTHSTEGDAIVGGWRIRVGTVKGVPPLFLFSKRGSYIVLSSSDLATLSDLIERRML